MLRLACWAMNTRFEVALWGRDATYLTAAGEEALREIRMLEQQLSFYRADSEIRHLNVYAARGPVPVEPGLFRLLQRARQLADATGGAFDPTAGPLVRCWGFAGEGGRVPTEAELSEALRVTGARHLLLDEENITVAFACEGVTLDLGAIGKGYAIEEAADVLRDHGLPGALIHGGTSSVYGLGVPPESDAWVVGIRHPTRGEERLTTVRLRDRGLGVSAPHGKFFVNEGERMGHVIDPRGGNPVRAAALAAVGVDSPTDADALSTALLVLGEPGLETIANGWPDAHALVAVQDGSEEEPRVALRAWES